MCKRLFSNIYSFFFPFWYCINKELKHHLAVPILRWALCMFWWQHLSDPVNILVFLGNGCFSCVAVLFIYLLGLLFLSFVLLLQSSHCVFLKIACAFQNHINNPMQLLCRAHSTLHVIQTRMQEREGAIFVSQLNIVGCLWNDNFSCQFPDEETEALRGAQNREVAELRSRLGFLWCWTVRFLLTSILSWLGEWFYSKCVSGH